MNYADLKPNIKIEKEQRELLLQKKDKLRINHEKNTKNNDIK